MTKRPRRRHAFSLQRRLCADAGHPRSSAITSGAWILRTRSAGTGTITKTASATISASCTAGFKDDRYGTPTYGHQYGIYYSVVGIKSDVWDNDGHAGGTGIGISGDYDGGNKPKKQHQVHQ